MKLTIERTVVILFVLMAVQAMQPEVFGDVPLIAKEQIPDYLLKCFDELGIKTHPKFDKNNNIFISEDSYYQVIVYYNEDGENRGVLFISIEKEHDKLNIIPLFRFTSKNNLTLFAYIVLHTIETSELNLLPYLNSQYVANADEFKRNMLNSISELSVLKYIYYPSTFIYPLIFHDYKNNNFIALDIFVIKSKFLVSEFIQKYLLLILDISQLQESQFSLDIIDSLKIYKINMKQKYYFKILQSMLGCLKHQIYVFFITNRINDSTEILSFKVIFDRLRPESFSVIFEFDTLKTTNLNITDDEVMTNPGTNKRYTVIEVSRDQISFMPRDSFDKLLFRTRSQNPIIF